MTSKNNLSIKLEDYITEYPSQTDPDIQSKIACKAEFIQVEGKAKEDPPKQGQKYSHQEYFLRLMRQYDRMFVMDQTGSGKCEAYDTPILMFDGSIKMVQDIQVGDKLMGPDSKSRTVLTLSRGRGEMFEVIPNKGRSFTCNGPHVLTLKGMQPAIVIVNKPRSFAVRYTLEGRYKSKAFFTQKEAEDFIETLEEDIYDIPLEEYMKLKPNLKKISRLFHVGVEFPNRNVPIDPYMIGFWLGDGTCSIPEITTADPEIVEYFQQNLLQYGTELHHIKSEKGMRYTIVGAGENFGKPRGNAFRNALIDLDMLNNKHIPNIYKINSREKRLDLLAGLIDSDGYYDPNSSDNYEIIQKNKRLADDIEYLCFSLGLMVTKTTCIKGCMYKGEMRNGEYVRLSIFGEAMGEILSSLERKRCQPQENRFKRETCQGFKIKSIGEDDYYGFQLNSDGRYLHSDFLVTHNSCKIIGLSEYYDDHPGEYKHVYVLEKGKTTSQDFKHQITCRCTDGKYETHKVQQTTDSKSRNVSLGKEIKKWYTVTTYKKFGSIILGMSDAQIKARFSNTHIYIDEAHALRNADKESKSPSKKKKDPDVKSKINNSQAYKEIWRVCHVADSIKVIITTATPNINDVGDCIPLFNLLLPANKQLPAHSTAIQKNINKTTNSEDLEYDYRFVTIDQMEPFLRGMISFVRSLDNNVDTKNMGVKIKKKIEIPFVDMDKEAKPLIKYNENRNIIYNRNNEITYYSQDIPNIEEKIFKAQTIVYPIRMSEFQAEIDEKASVKHQNTGKTSKGIAARHHASVFVFPDKSYGGSFSDKKPFGLPNYVDRTNKEIKPNKELEDLLKNPDDLWKHSCKFYEILRIEEENRDSKCFIYTDAVTGAGSILLSLMFEAWGYEKFDQEESVFTHTYSKDKNVEKKNVKKSFEKKKRYTLIGSETTEGRIASMMELYNSDENAHGEYIKIIIGTLVARDGINLYNVLRGYLLKAGWHPSGDLQALNRFIRAISHEYLLKEARDRGEINPRIEVQVYRLCSYRYVGMSDDDDKIKKQITPKKKLNDPDRQIIQPLKMNKYMNKKELRQRFSGKFLCEPDEIISVDMKLYIDGEIKDIYNLRFNKIFKRLAIDGLNNRDRNIRDTDKDGSIKADYGIAKYKYWAERNLENDFKCEEIDYSTYDILYSDKDINKFCESIIEHLIINGSIKIDNIFEIWKKDYRENIIWFGIERLLEFKKSINNRFGLLCYINYSNGIIFIQNDFPFNEEKDNIFYSNIYVANEKINISNILNEIMEPEQDSIIKKILEIKNTKNTDEIDNLIEELNINFKSKLLETALSDLKENGENISPIIKYILTKYNMYFHIDVIEPLKDIEEMAKNLTNKKYEFTEYTGIDDAHKDGTPYEEGEDIDDDDHIKLEKVYIHNLYSTDLSAVSYKTSTNFKNVKGIKRILKPSEGSNWRNLTEYEEGPYINIIQFLNKKRNENITQYPIYASLINNEFKIIDNKHTNTKNKTKDKRNENRGKQCISYDIPDLIKILIHEKITTKTVSMINADTVSDEIDENTSEAEKYKLKIEYLVGKKYFKSKNDAPPKNPDNIKIINNICKWFLNDKNNKNNNKPTICTLLLNNFKKKNKIIEA